MHSGDKAVMYNAHASIHRPSLNAFGIGGANSLSAHQSARNVLFLFGELSIKAYVK